MTRQVAIPCSSCGRKFGGDETLCKHRVIAGDRGKCQNDATLLARKWYRDQYAVWHRPGPSARLRPTLFDGDGGEAFEIRPTAPTLLARSTDPLTSKVAARAVAYKTGTAKARLLAVYIAEPSGLTDEQAAARAGMELYGASKRCSELVRDGLIEPIGVRKGRSGLERRVCSFVVQEALLA